MVGGPFPFQPSSIPGSPPSPPCTLTSHSPLATFQHPASLNALQQFGQACSILRNTTRASNPAWYQDALELNFQLHIRPDGPQISTFYFDRKKGQWSNGPALSEEILHDSAKLEPVHRRSPALRPLQRCHLAGRRFSTSPTNSPPPNSSRNSTTRPPFPTCGMPPSTIPPPFSKTPPSSPTRPHGACSPIPPPAAR